jgi:hypothetical protein
VEPLIFDHVCVVGVMERDRPPDGRAYDLLAINVGEGESDIALLHATASGSAGDGLAWTARAVEQRARTHPNNGGKLAALGNERLSFDSRHAGR